MDAEFGNCHFSKEQFIEFHKLENYTEPLMMSLKDYEENKGKIDERIFVKIVKLTTGLDVTLEQGKIVMSVFSDGHGELAIKEFVSALENRCRGHHSVKLIKRNKE